MRIHRAATAVVTAKAAAPLAATTALVAVKDELHQRVAQVKRLTLDPVAPDAMAKAAALRGDPFAAMGISVTETGARAMVSVGDAEVRQLLAELKAEPGAVVKDGGVKLERDGVCIEVKRHSAGDVNLPGKIERAFDPKRPVLERIIERTVKGENGSTHLERERAWFQGQTRVTETSADGHEALLLEKQTGDRKESQLFLKSTEDSVLTHTELLPGGAVRETQELWDTKGKTLGDSDKPELLSRTVTDRTFGADGKVSRVHRVTEGATLDFTRTVKGDVTLSEVRSELEGRVSKMTRTQKKGECVAVELEGPKQRLSLARDGDAAVTWQVTDRETGKSSEGRLEASVTGVKLTLNGKTIDAGKDLDAALAKFGPSDFASLDLALRELSVGDRLGKLQLTQAIPRHLEKGKALYERISPLADVGEFVNAEKGRIERTIDAVRGVAPSPGAGAPPSTLMGQVVQGFDFIGAGTEALAAFHDVTHGEYLRGALHGAKSGINAARTAERLFGHLSTGTALLRSLSGASAGIDVAMGAIAIAKADNRYGRMHGAGSMTTAALRVGLVVTAASGPAAPFLLGGLALAEATKFYLSWREKRYVPPVAAGLVA